ncbi:hypothetical protein GN956_G11907 [Arapaima gigas]
MTAGHLVVFLLVQRGLSNTCWFSIPAELCLTQMSSAIQYMDSYVCEKIPSSSSITIYNIKFPFLPLLFELKK